MASSLQDDLRHLGAVGGKELPCRFFEWLKLFLHVFPRNYGFHVLLTYRCYQSVLPLETFQYLYIGVPLKYFFLLLHRLLEKAYDIHIALQAQIGPGLYIGHFGGIRIGVCTIGQWCNINHQVTIGAMPCAEGREDTPVVIGDRVWIGAYSKIKSGVTIHSGATLSAGTYVAKDVPASVLVAGPSGRILQKNYDNSFLLGLLPEAGRYSGAAPGTE